MYDGRTLVISSENMEPTKFDSMRKTAKAIGIGEGVIRYVRNNVRDFLKGKLRSKNVKPKWKSVKNEKISK